MPPSFLRPPSLIGREFVKRQIAGQISRLFNDPTRDEAPVVPNADALFPPGATTRRVLGDVVAMLVGSTSALLLQMLHPAVLAGVWDHSDFRSDMSGRLRRTARFIAQTTYGHRLDALASITRVLKIHEHIRGKLPDGTAYHANDPELLAWVHLTEAISFLTAWTQFANPRAARVERDAYFAEMA